MAHPFYVPVSIDADTGRYVCASSSSDDGDGDGARYLLSGVPTAERGRPI